MPERCFVASSCPSRCSTCSSRSRTRCARWRRAWSGEKWVRAELLHVTVAFAGPIADTDLEGRIARLHAVGERHAAFTLRLSGAQAVPSARRARMVWAVLGPGPGPAAELRDDIMRALDLPTEATPYRPHVTLARARRSRALDADVIAHVTRDLAVFGKTPVGSVSVRSLTLLSSTLGSGGPTYRPLAVVPLTGRRGAPAAD